MLWKYEENTTDFTQFHLKHGILFQQGCLDIKNEITKLNV